MENYKKGRNTEEPEDPNSFGILWDGSERISIHYVTGRTDPKAVLKELRREYREKGILALSGVGPFVSRVISIAEELKKAKPQEGQQHYQYNHISVKRFEEHWDPVFKDDDLESLCVVREVPRISIVLSTSLLEDINIQEPQRSGMRSLQTFFNESDQRSNRRRGNRGPRPPPTKAGHKSSSVSQKDQ